MAASTYAYTNSKYFLGTLLASALTAIFLQRFDPALILILSLLPWFIILFYYYPMILVGLWHILAIVTILFPDLSLTASSILFLPMDPAYFFSLIYIAMMILLRPESFVKTFKENPFLFLFIAIVVAYIVIYTTLYGKSAIGETRKSYFFFLYPIVFSLSDKTFTNLQRSLLLFSLISLVCLVVSIKSLIMGFHVRYLASGSTSLIFSLQIFLILVSHINKQVVINRLIDILILVVSLAFLVLGPHRSVIMATAAGLCLILFMFRSRLIFLSKFFVSLVALFTIITIAVLNIPAFEKISIRPLKGIIDPKSDGTASWRMVAWQQQLSKASTQEFLFGKGFGNYFSWYDKKYRQKFTVSPHNRHFQYLS